MITAWTDTGTGTLWLRDYLPKEIPVARILTFGYESSASSFYSDGCAETIQKHAHTLVASLQADRLLMRCEHRPILFICHGLGGVLVKKALAYSASRTSAQLEHLYGIYVSTYGILFFGTPQTRIDIANWLVLESIQKSEPHPTIRADEKLDTLTKKDTETLEIITDQFAPLMKQFHIFFFWEEVRTSFGNWSGFIVEESSAAPILDDTVATHRKLFHVDGMLQRQHLLERDQTKLLSLWVWILIFITTGFSIMRRMSLQFQRGCVADIFSHLQRPLLILLDVKKCL